MTFTPSMFVLLIVLVVAALTVRAAIARKSIILEPTFNRLAVIGFVLAFVVPPAGVVVSHIALAQVKRARERGWGLAIAGLWVGYCFTVILALYIPLFAYSAYMSR